MTVDQLQQGWIYKDRFTKKCGKGYGELININLDKTVYLDCYFEEIARINGNPHISHHYHSYNKNLKTSILNKLIEINLARLVSEDSEKNAKAELLNVKNLLLEEQVNSQLTQSCIEILEIAKVNMLTDLNLVIIEKNEIQDDLDQEHLKNEEAQRLIHEQKALIENQNAEINLLKQTMEEMATMINSLKDEKLKYSIENISLESKFKTDKIEYKRRLKNHEEMNSHLLTDLRQKKHELTEITSELSKKTFELGEHKEGNSKICSENWIQHFDSQQESYATSDDEGEICLTSLK
ncbi:MAG: hypothetical protein H0T62_13390 [Parachlamydiaceae bacterium]|nr:hypothetical protein [Parachlamydiaceae bacterium]